MPTYLAKLADLKAALGETTSDLDAILTSCLAAASSMAESAAGVRDGGLRRQASIVELPRGGSVVYSRRLYLAVRPIESVTEIIQLWHSATAADFDAATPLVGDDDYAIDSIDLGTVARLNAQHWYLGEPHTIRVSYTAGYVDPADEDPPADAIAPPQDLQRGVISQAVQLYNLRDKAGQRYANSGDRQQGFTQGGVLPELWQAVQRHRRLL